MNFMLEMAHNSIWLAGNAPGAILLGVMVLAWLLPVAVAVAAD
jgi:hypothetical protein